MNNSESELIYLVFIKDDINLLEIDLSIEGIAYNSISANGFLETIREISREFDERNIEVIDKGELKIIAIKHQEISAFYITHSDSAELRAKIQSLLELFVSRFKKLIINVPADISLFENFKEIILNFLSDNIVKEYYIVKTTNYTPKNSIPGDYWSLISKINDNRTITEIAKKMNLDLKEVKKNIAYLKSKDLITFSIHITPYDIPFLSPKGISNLFNTNENYVELISRLGENQFKIIKYIDSKSSVIELAQKSSINLPEILEILKNLLMKGYIDLLSEDLKWCVIFENLYKSFLHLVKKVLGDIGLKIFKGIIEDETSPLIKLIKFTDSYTPSFDAVKFHVKNQKNISIYELHSIFLTPLLNTIKTLKSALDVISSKYIIKFKKSVLISVENLTKIYGLENIQKLKENLEVN